MGGLIDASGGVVMTDAFRSVRTLVGGDTNRVQARSVYRATQSAQLANAFSALDKLYPYGYFCMTPVFFRTAEFDAWLRALDDAIGKARILARIRAAELGHFGDCAPVGDGVFELRIHVGPGYRVYYWRRGTHTYWLLCGGAKSTQRRDISKAKALRTRLENEL